MRRPKEEVPNQSSTCDFNVGFGALRWSALIVSGVLGLSLGLVRQEGYIFGIHPKYIGGVYLL